MVISKIGVPKLPTDWSGEVHSVFQNSCNIRLSGGPLVCLHRFDFGILPHSFYVPELNTHLFQPGQLVQATPEGLMIDGALVFRWADHMEVVDTQVMTGALPHTWSDEWQTFNQLQQTQQNTPDMMGQVYASLTCHLGQLLPAVFAADQEAVAKHCHACVGLGQGLTPSGDDMLLGVLAALHRYDPASIPLLRQAIPPLLHRTNEISASYLDLAMQGYVATPVLDVLHHLGQNWDAPKRILLSVGHSSGSDILYGILTAVKELWDKEKGRK